MGKWLFNSLFPGENITYKEKLIQCVNKQMSGHQISAELGIDYSCVHRWLRKLGLNLPNYHNELKFDNTVFDVIDTEEKAYWLGFMYADGYVSKDRKTVELSLMGADVEHLQKFATFLHHRDGVRIGTSKYNGKTFSRCRLILTNSHFNEALVKLGCIPNKSLILKFPDITIFSSEELIRHFIRGYVDGDGHVGISQNDYSRFEIIGTLEFLDGIKHYFPNLFTMAYYKNKRKINTNTYFLSITGKKAAEFGDILYKDASIYLQRKYDKFIKNKYDEREHLRRMHTFSEKQQLYFARGRNRIRENSNQSSII